MAHHPSAQKRQRQNMRRRLRNQAIRTRLKTEVKKMEELLKTRDLSQIREGLRLIKELHQRAASKGIIPPRRASRIISRVTLKVKKILGTVPD